MSLLCAVFGFLITDCKPLEDRVWSFEITGPVLKLMSCESIDDYEVCAWVEDLKLVRFYPKQQSATLYRGAQVLEGRSIKLPDGFRTTFTFEWNGPDRFLLGSFSETHESVMRELAPILSRHGLVPRGKSEPSPEQRHFGGLAHIPADQFITGLVVRATCEGEVPLSRSIVILNYPTPKSMLNCLRKQ